MANSKDSYIHKALSLIHEDDQGIYIASSFMSFLSDIHVAAVRGQPTPAVLAPLLYVHQDIWNLATLVQRLDWQHQLKREGKLSDDQWMSFAAADIDHFHVEFRSLFDYLALLLKHLADEPNQVIQGSFEELRNWLKKSPGNRRRFGDDLAKLVVQCDWFSDLRAVRDTTVHRGGFTIVFPDQDRILFQVQDQGRRVVQSPDVVMWTPNVVKFELYAGFYSAKLLDFLEALAKVLEPRVNVEPILSRTRSYHPGFGVVKTWISELAL